MEELAAELDCQNQQHSEVQDQGTSPPPYSLFPRDGEITVMVEGLIDPPSACNTGVAPRGFPDAAFTSFPVLFESTM